MKRNRRITRGRSRVRNIPVSEELSELLEERCRHQTFSSSFHFIILFFSYLMLFINYRCSSSDEEKSPCRDLIFTIFFVSRHVWLLSPLTQKERMTVIQRCRGGAATLSRSRAFLTLKCGNNGTNWEHYHLIFSEETWITIIIELHFTFFIQFYNYKCIVIVYVSIIGYFALFEFQ